MPELPEVETVRRGLQPAMEGARIERTETRRAGLRFPFQADFAARLRGRTVSGLGVSTDGDILGLSPGNSDNPDDWSHR